ncbi:MAG: trypsin-like peptidase domain-containing protein [Armatimonadetes bacterium]|nr:trypsin-like peptidase domain-containing protein [Armatimonadota bacterium]
MNGGAGRVLLTVVLSLLCGFGGGVGGYFVAARVRAPAAETNPPDAGGGGTKPALRPGADTDTGSAIAAAAKRVSPAVVNVDNFGSTPQLFGSPFEDLFGHGQGGQGRGESQLRGSGSGFIIDGEKGLVMTNQHVVEGAERLEVTLTDDRSFHAEVAGSDKMSDIAILRIEPNRLPVAPLGSATHLEPGQWVIAIGNPFRDFPHTVTVGVVSALNRHMPVGDRQYNNLIQTDAAINMGNSGGPLCNLAGEVIGVNSAIFSPTQTYAGIGFAIVIDDAKVIAGHLIGDGGVPWMGISMNELTPELAKQLGIATAKGVVISDVFEGGPAAKAGVQPNDVLVKFGETTITSSDQVPGLVLKTKVGQVVHLVVLRDGHEKKVNVTVGQRQSE